MIFYVYIHKDPKTKEIVYIGKGCHGRAWDVTRCRTENKEHQTWMKNLCLLGHVPSEWVEILHKKLTEKEAFDLEKHWQHLNGQPKFNRTSGEKNNQAKLTDNQAREIFIKTKTTNLTHKKIADEYGVSRSAVSMISTRKQWKAATSCLTK